MINFSIRRIFLISKNIKQLVILKVININIANRSILFIKRFFSFFRCTTTHRSLHQWFFYINVFFTTANLITILWNILIWVNFISLATISISYSCQWLEWWLLNISVTYIFLGIGSIWLFKEMVGDGVYWTV